MDLSYEMLAKSILRTCTISGLKLTLLLELSEVLTEVADCSLSLTLPDVSFS